MQNPTGLALCLAAVIGLVALPAQARDRDRGGRVEHRLDVHGDPIDHRLDGRVIASNQASTGAANLRRPCS